MPSGAVPFYRQVKLRSTRLILPIFSCSAGRKGPINAGVIQFSAMLLFLDLVFLSPLGDLEMDLSGDIPSQSIPIHPTFRFECSKLLLTLQY